MAEQLFRRYRQEALTVIPLHHLGNVVAVARTALYLLQNLEDIQASTRRKRLFASWTVKVVDRV